MAIALLCAAALYTHYLALFAVLVLLLLAFFAGRRREALGLLVGTSLFLPWIPILISQPKAALAWMVEAPAQSALGFLSALGGAGRIPAPFGPPLPAALVWGGRLLGVFLLLTLLSLGRRDASLRRAVLFVAAVLSAILLLSFWRPLAFAGRSEMVVLPVWLWALARGAPASATARWGSRGMILVGSAACLLVALGKVPDPAPRQPLAALSRDARAGDVLFAGADFYLPARLASERGDLGMQVHAFPAKVAEHPGWFAPHVPTDRDYHDLASARKHGGGRVFLLIPPSYRTPAVEAIPGWREMGRSPAGVLLVWE